MSGKAPMSRIQQMDEHYEQQAAPPDSSSHNGAKVPGVSQFLSDAVELSELQARLVASDLRRSLELTVRPLLAACLGIVVLLGATPVVLLALAQLMADTFGWETTDTQFAVAGLAVLVGGALSAAAAIMFRQCAKPLVRSLRECSENLSCLKKMLGGTTERHRDT